MTESDFTPPEGITVFWRHDRVDALMVGSCDSGPRPHPTDTFGGLRWLAADLTQWAEELSLLGGCSRMAEQIAGRAIYCQALADLLAKSRANNWPGDEPEYGNPVG